MDIEHDGGAPDCPTRRTRMLQVHMRLEWSYLLFGYLQADRVQASVLAGVSDLLLYGRPEAAPAHGARPKASRPSPWNRELPWKGLVQAGPRTATL